METYEKNQLLRKKIVSYLKDKINSGELTTINDYEMSIIEFGNAIYDENGTMFFIEESIWNKLPTKIQEEITVLSNL